MVNEDAVALKDFTQEQPDARNALRVVALPSLCLELHS